jgi:hypothetical protein
VTTQRKMAAKAIAAASENYRVTAILDDAAQDKRRAVAAAFWYGLHALAGGAASIADAEDLYLGQKSDAHAKTETVGGMLDYVGGLSITGGAERAKTAEQIAASLASGRGPVILGLDWREGLDDGADAHGRVSYAGDVRGGHCVMLSGIGPLGVRVVNAWGVAWASGGRAWLSLADLRSVMQTGEAVILLPKARN